MVAATKAVKKDVRESTATLAQVARVQYLIRVWTEIVDRFQLKLPHDVLITCGWTSRNARGSVTKRVPCEINLSEWKGSETEKAFISVHPERFRTPEEVVLATLFAAGKQVHGRRRGAELVGLEKDRETGNIRYTDGPTGEATRQTIGQIVHNLGELPSGFADMPATRKVQRTRLRKYVCDQCGLILRIAADNEPIVHAKDDGVFVQEEVVSPESGQSVQAEAELARPSPLERAKQLAHVA